VPYHGRHRFTDMTQHPNIQGDWVPADQSQTRMEVASTEEPDILAIRDNFNPNEVVYATRKQVRGLADSLQTGRLSNLINR